MRRPNRNIEIFSMSALDVLAMSTGVFVVIVTLMLPYYQRTLDAQASTVETQQGIEAVEARRAELENRTASVNASAGEIESQVAAAAAQNAALDEQIAEIEIKVGQLQAETARPVAPRKDPRKTAQASVIKELDVVFVMDTTRSMEPAMRDLALSLRGIITVLEKLVPSVRVGFVAYTDADTGYRPIHALPLTDTKTGLNQVLGFVAGLRPPPRGSPTIDEDMDRGVNRALGMNWRGSGKQVMVVIGDATPHSADRGATMRMAQGFRASGAKRAVSTLFVSTPSSRRRGDAPRPFFTQLAAIGGGEFNDHSGRMFESIILSVLVD